MTQIRVGDLLDGYSGGAFGLYVDYVRVEAFGADWIVARACSEDAAPVFYDGDIDELVRYHRKSPTT